MTAPDPLRDPDLVFDDDQHRYTLASDPVLQLTSVTQLVKSYTRPFDAATAAARVAARDGRTVQAVRQEWDSTSEAACTLGTAVHAAMERVALNTAQRRGVRYYHFPGRQAHPYAGHVAAGDRWFSDHPEMLQHPLTPELRICLPAAGLAGTIDLVCHLDGVLTIVDFKTNRRLDMFAYGGATMYAPLNHLPDSNYYHYLCQLNCYALMMDRRLGLQVEQLKLVWLRDTGEYTELYVPLVPDLVAPLFKRGPRKART